jgi:hypothetical protein
MFGKSRRGLAYYACEPDQHYHAQRSAWQPGHPASLWVREDILLDVVHGFFAERARMLSHAISDIERRKHALIAELEAQPGGGDDGNDPDAAGQYRQAIKRRFTQLVAEHRAKTGELAQLAAHQARSRPARSRPARRFAAGPAPARRAARAPPAGACTAPSSSRSAITAPGMR